MVPLEPQTPMELKILKIGVWKTHRFAKIPLELMLCDELQPTSKLLWIVLANQADFKSIEKAVLDRCIGIHRSTRIRCLAELRHFGLVEGEEPNIFLPDPIPILTGIKENRTRIDEQARQSFGLKEAEKTVTEPQQPRPKKVNEKIAESWNRNRPNSYATVAKISDPIAKAVQFHMNELGLKPDSYDEFFCALSTGIIRSKFWSNQNTHKTLSSIIGIGTPEEKKRQNVFNLYNDGVERIQEGYKPNSSSNVQSKDKVVYPSSYRCFIEDYEAAQLAYSRAIETDSKTYIDGSSDRIVECEQKIAELGLNPADFRYALNILEWPTDTPHPKGSRVQFWSYDDEEGATYE